MATSPVLQVVQRIRQSLLQEGAGLSDANLLGQFIEHRDDAAFAALVRKHGPMIFGVCRRLLGNSHDAEDAFQATFLVLVRKARSISAPGKLAGWLYGVAYQTALKARAMNRKRRAREVPVADLPERGDTTEEAWSDLQPLLDQELSRLPEKYRLPIILCDMEGRPRKEAAKQLGWPEGTLSGRLSRGRRVLADRLTKRGVVFSGGALAGLLSHQAASGALPTAMVSSTIEAASLLAAGAAAHGVISTKVAALMEGVLKSMFITKLKLVTALLMAAVLGWAMLPLNWTAAAQDSRSAPLTAEAPSPAKDDSLRGIWTWVGIDTDELSATFEKHGVRLVITNDFWIWEERGKDRAFIYKTDATRSPKHLDLTVQNIKGQEGKVILGIYEIDGDTLKVCESEGPRPTTFKGGRGMTLFTFKRVTVAASSVQTEAISGTQLKRIGISVKEDLTGKLMFGVGRNEADSKRTASDDDMTVVATRAIADVVWDRIGLKLEAVDAAVVSNAGTSLRGGMRITAIRKSPAVEAKLQVGDVLVGLHSWEVLNRENVLFVLGHCDGANLQSVGCHVVRNSTVRSCQLPLSRNHGPGPTK